AGRLPDRARHVRQCVAARRRPVRADRDRAAGIPVHRADAGRTSRGRRRGQPRDHPGLDAGGDAMTLLDPSLGPPVGTEPTPTADGRAAVVPALREWTAGAGRLDLGLPGVMSWQGDGAGEVADLLAGDLELFRGRRPEIVAGGAGDIRLRLDPALADLPDQGYRLLIDDQVRVLAADRSGLLHGSQSVAQLIKQDPDRRSLPRGAAFDHPRCSIRGQMIDVGRKFLPLDYLRSEIRRMAWLKLNSLHLHLTEWNGFRFESREFPGLASAE